MGTFNMNEQIQCGVKHPGEEIRKELKKRQWTQEDFALILGRPLPVVSKIINGKTSITPDTAKDLADAFGVDAECWLRLDSAYRLSKIKRRDDSIRKRAYLYKIAPAKEMERRGWIGRIDSIEKLERELLNFFGVDTLDQPPVIPFVARTSAKKNIEISASHNAWCFRAAQLAKNLNVSKFTKNAFDIGCQELKKLAAYPEDIRRVPRTLASMGIRFVVLEHLKKTKIDGAVLWIGQKSPVVVMSLRYDRIDYFWHTLAHELSHIRHYDAFNLDSDLIEARHSMDTEYSDIEERADREATELLIPKQIMDSFTLRVKPFYSKQRIIQFAHRIGIHPGIIAGQLQYRGEIKYTANKEMLAKIRYILIQEALTDGWGRAVNIN